MVLMSYAEAACAALVEAMERDERVVILGEDLGRGGIFGQYAGLQQRFGASRVIDTPISEATMMGAAVGMALAGLRPVVEMRLTDFALCAIDEVVNQAAKIRFMLDGQGRVPLVVRMPMGIWSASAAQHSQSLEAWFAHTPGLVVAAPATPADNYALLQAVINCDDPVIYLEHKELWGEQGEVDRDRQTTLGCARVVRPGKDITLVTWSKMLGLALRAAEALGQDGLSVELIDLRTIWPWDRQTVLASAARTGRLLVVHESVQAGGFGAEIAATVAETLGIPVMRLGAPRILVGYSPPLEREARISVGDIMAKLMECGNQRRSLSKSGDPNQSRNYSFHGEGG